MVEGQEEASDKGTCRGLCRDMTKLSILSVVWSGQGTCQGSRSYQGSRSVNTFSVTSVVTALNLNVPWMWLTCHKSILGDTQLRCCIPLDCLFEFHDYYNSKPWFEARVFVFLSYISYGTGLSAGNDISLEFSKNFNCYWLRQILHDNFYWYYFNGLQAYGDIGCSLMVAVQIFHWTTQF